MSRCLVDLLVRPTARPLAVGIVVATTFILAETVLAYLLERIFPGMPFGVVFLLGVLVVSAGWGFRLAVSTTLASALVYAFVHLDADGSVFPITAADTIAIVVFVPIALLANVLAGQARLRAAEANRRRRDAEESRDAIRMLADQQAALRRIATLVARAVPPYEVFSAVAEELARCLEVTHATLVRFEADGGAVLLASHDDRGVQKRIPVGKRFSFDGESVPALVFRTGSAARRDSHEHTHSADVQYIHELGLRSGVGVPIVVDGRLWGAANVGSSRPEPLPADTEARVGDFADLVATAIANADARTELTASRARIVAASDAARRRFERDLHDGAQQRLVSLGLQLRTVEASLPSESLTLRAQVSEMVLGLSGVSQDLQEISRGIHPAILSRGGLGPALKTLARRSAVPVELDLGIDRRLPESVEVAAYYVVAEGLTNAAKYAQASEVTVDVQADGANLRVSISDDGIGGADSHKGSGLIGLIDRVEALGGQLRISSVVGTGTSLLATIPFDGS
ncbi:histidine kinase,GAF domain-containing protein [Mycobacterium sp. JS623]|uniref:GAF domain-containing sensor histidine kinase n=1 Tax=Mycobacterium sp. JS623 TaxID=212767 RepID=UPI0002A56B9A|nr:GAF domain-containing sensor histidine kinase [Mycobacterium sp. JS623]AGB21048.1 histidine kinase,GAF domain-containing protein [Mycobacterium sp. JS623]